MLLLNVLLLNVWLLNVLLKMWLRRLWLRVRGNRNVLRNCNSSLVYSTYHPPNYDVHIPSLSGAAKGDTAEDIRGYIRSANSPTRCRRRRPISPKTKASRSKERAQETVTYAPSQPLCRLQRISRYMQIHFRRIRSNVHPSQVRYAIYLSLCGREDENH